MKKDIHTLIARTKRNQGQAIQKYAAAQQQKKQTAPATNKTAK